MTDPLHGGSREPAGRPPRRRDRAFLRLADFIFQLAHGSYRVARRIIIGILGVSIVLVGLVMTLTPGPAIIVIPLGLGILALEFAWARRLLRLFRVRAKQMYRDQRRGDYRFWRHWWRRR